MPAGRPSTFNAATVAKVLDRMARGELLVNICAEEGMPGASTVRSWARGEKGAPPEFGAAYAQARRDQASALAEDALRIADDSTDDFREIPDGHGGTKTVLNAEHVQRSRLRVDTRKWMASKLSPKVWGDKVQHEHAGPDGGPIHTLQELVTRAEADERDEE